VQFGTDFRKVPAASIIKA